MEQGVVFLLVFILLVVGVLGFVLLEIKDNSIRDEGYNSLIDKALQMEEGVICNIEKNECSGVVTLN